jgi:energy-coupling factor transport system substrate-specific component
MANLETRSLILISAAVVINVVAAVAVTFLKLPLYLDSIGTVIVAILAGPLAGAIAGALAVVIATLTFNPLALPFLPVAMMVGVTAGWLARLGGFRAWWLALLSGAVIGVQTTLLATPIIVFLFGGVSGVGADFASAYMLALGSSLITSVGVTNLSISLIDKTLTALIAFFIANRLPLRLLMSYGYFAHSRRGPKIGPGSAARFGLDVAARKTLLHVVAEFDRRVARRPFGART